PVTTLLRALGFGTDFDLLRMFDLSDEIAIKTKKAFADVIGKRLATPIVQEIVEEVTDEDTGEVKEAIKRVPVLERDHELVEDDFDILKEAGVSVIHILKMSAEDADRSVILNTMRKDSTYNEETALGEVYRQIRTGE